MLAYPWALQGMFRHHYVRHCRFSVIHHRYGIMTLHVDMTKFFFINFILLSEMNHRIVFEIFYRQDLSI